MMIANEKHYKCMLRAVKYVMDTKDYGLEMKPKITSTQPWEMKSYVDSDWAGDRSTRKSVSGWLIMINECVVGWGSRGQKCVSLSSTEAEYVDVSEIIKELLFIKKTLEFLSVSIAFPIIIHCDNVGALYLCNNADGQRTKHIGVRYHFVRQYVEDGIVKIIFVRSEDNKADIFTKNTKDDVFKRHTKYMKQFGKKVSFKL